MRARQEIMRLGGVAWALAYLRLRQYAGGAAWARLALAFAATLGLLLLAVEPGDAARFWQLAGTTLALKFLPALCLVRCGDALRSELKDGTIEYLWTRPVRRDQLFLGFYVESVVGIGMIALAVFLGAAAAGIYLGVAGGLWHLFLLALGIGLPVVVFAALSLAMAAATGKFALLGLLYLLLIEFGAGWLPGLARSLTASHHLQRILAPVFGEGQGFAWSSIGALGIIAAVFLLLGAVLFSAKSYAVGADKEG